MGTYKEIDFDKELSIEKGDTFEYILNQVLQVEKNDIVCINLDSIDVLDAEKLVLLIIVVYLLSKVVLQPISIRGSQAVLNYLYTIQFFELGYVNNRNKNLKKIEQHSAIIPIKKFVGSSGRADLLSLIRNASGVNKEIEYKVSQVIKNLSDNCVEHTSNNPNKTECFAFAERMNSVTRIALMDFGGGFYESFARNGKIYGIKDDREAVIKVLENHASSREEESIGFGIYDVEELIAENEGRMIIVTGDVLAIYHAGKIYSNVEIPFLQGSCIYVEMKDENLVD